MLTRNVKEIDMIDVVALGELLIDFTPYGESESGMQLFEQNPGGAPANVLCTLAKLGMKTAFIGKVGNDMHGQMLQDVLQDSGVDTTGLLMDADVFTTLAFVQLSSKGERSFSFARKPGADMRLRADELNVNLLRSCKILHFGSLSLTDEPARSATWNAISIAKEAGALISYDPNYRAPLWHDIAEAVAQMRSVLPLVDIIKISDEETDLLTGKENPVDAAQVLLKQGCRCVVVSMGKQGAYLATDRFQMNIPTYADAPVVDTTGAGDSFWGGFLFGLLEHNLTFSDFKKLRYCAQIGNAVATLCIGKRGAIPALPDLNSVLSIAPHFDGFVV